MGISPTLNIPQARFLAMQHKFKAYVAGFGSGKTWVGCGGNGHQQCDVTDDYTRSVSGAQRPEVRHSCY